MTASEQLRTYRTSIAVLVDEYLVQTNTGYHTRCSSSIPGIALYRGQELLRTKLVRRHTYRSTSSMTQARRAYPYSGTYDSGLLVRVCTYCCRTSPTSSEMTTSPAWRSTRQSYSSLQSASRRVSHASWTRRNLSDACDKDKRHRVQCVQRTGSRVRAKVSRVVRAPASQSQSQVTDGLHEMIQYIIVDTRRPNSYVLALVPLS